jgi:hypothetical protein
MSESIKLNLSRLGLTIAILTGVGAFGSAWVVLPTRVSAHDIAISKLEGAHNELNKELLRVRVLLERIDERTVRIEKKP